MAQTPNIDPQYTWVTSDTHFGHNNIVGFCDRPNEHEERIIQRWNEAVPDDGTVLHLGDFSYRNNAYTKNMIAPHLKGKRKLLVLGNHDKGRPSFYRSCDLKVVKPFEIKFETYTISFSHYPLTKPAHPFHIRIHGHIHNNGYGGVKHAFAPFAKNQINVSVEQTHYKPVNLAVLLDGYLNGVYEDEHPFSRDNKKAVKLT